MSGIFDWKLYRKENGPKILCRTIFLRCFYADEFSDKDNILIIERGSNIALTEILAGSH